MGSKKLVWCCVAGIVLGYVAPFFFGVARSTSLSVGMVVGLGLGYLLDILDEKKEKDAGSAVLSQKAVAAGKMIEQARAEIQGTPYDGDGSDAETAVKPAEAGLPAEDELSPEEQREKMDEAEDLLRKARERMGKQDVRH